MTKTQQTTLHAILDKNETLELKCQKVKAK